MMHGATHGAARLYVVGAVDALRVAPDDEVDSCGVVVGEGEDELHVGEDGVVVHPQHPLDACLGVGLGLGLGLGFIGLGLGLRVGASTRCLGRGCSPGGLEVPRGDELRAPPHLVPVQRRVHELVAQREAHDPVAPPRRARQRLVGGDHHHRAAGQQRLEAAPRAGDGRAACGRQAVPPARAARRQRYGTSSPVAHVKGEHAKRDDEDGGRVHDQPALHRRLEALHAQHDAAAARPRPAAARRSRLAVECSQHTHDLEAVRDG
eukprot:scaffold12384_cov56-Phaeocystis_antarctica.AAC.1